MKLITEEVARVKFIVEGKGDKKRMYIEGVFLQGEIKNRNGRMYPISTLSKEVNRYNESFVKKGRALGELGHPEGPTVNLDRVSHKITSLVQEGNNFRGKAQLLSTPMGKIAQNLIGEGVTLGVSGTDSTQSGTVTLNYGDANLSATDGIGEIRKVVKVAVRGSGKTHISEVQIVGDF